MAIGDVSEVDVGSVTGVHCLDTGMYDVPEYGAVYILDAERPAVVDTGIGTGYERVLEALDVVGIDREDLAVIAPTHVHLDHAGGAGFLARECPNAEVVTHEIGAPHLVDPERLVEGTKRAVGDQWRYYTEPEPVPEDRLSELTDGDRIDLGDRVLDVHHAPGHAPHQTVFHDPDEAVVFTADAAGIWIPGLSRLHPTTPPPNFDLEQCIEDARMIDALDPEVLCFGHFGPAPAGDKLARYETVLSDWVAAIDERRGDRSRDEIVEDLIARDDADEAWGERKERDEATVNVDGVLLYLERREE